MNQNEKILVKLYRKAYPKSRIISIIKFRKNTSCIKRKECVLCKEKGPSWSSKYPKTKLAIKWEHEHKKSHGC